MTISDKIIGWNDWWKSVTLIRLWLDGAVMLGWVMSDEWCSNDGRRLTRKTFSGHSSIGWILFARHWHWDISISIFVKAHLIIQTFKYFNFNICKTYLIIPIFKYLFKDIKKHSSGRKSKTYIISIWAEEGKVCF